MCRADAWAPRENQRGEEVLAGCYWPGVLRVLRLLLDLIKAPNTGAASPEAMDDSPRVQPG